MSHQHTAVRWGTTAGILAMFCLFSFGTTKLRARVHQTRRQTLVSQDSGDRWARAIPLAPIAVSAAVEPRFSAPPRLEHELDEASRPLPAARILPAPQPQRGPPLGI